MSAAADAEDKTEKSVVTPGWLLPARELQGTMLLAQGRPKEALAAFEATLAKEPSRYNAVAGAAKAAEAAGDKAQAKSYHQRLAELGTGGNADRPGLIAAREFLAKN
jgi:Tfp pilus assembly protein PilF